MDKESGADAFPELSCKVVLKSALDNIKNETRRKNK